MEVSYYLKRPAAKSETAIFARISYDGCQLKYYIPEKIDPKHWNKETHRARESRKFIEFPEFNNRLNIIESTIKTTYRKFINDNGEPPSPTTYKTLLDAALKKKAAKGAGLTSFFPYFEDFIKRSKDGSRVGAKTKTNIAKGTSRGFAYTLDHIKAFQEKYSRKIDFDTIDLEFHNDFTAHLTRNVKLSNNTIGDHFKRLRTVLNEATEKGINKNMAFRSRYFSIINEPADTIYLTTDELQELASLNLADIGRLDRLRDLFLVGCYTGLRFGDYSKLRPEHINDGFIEITQTKTGAPVVIPLHPVVESILQKYGGALPKALGLSKTNEYLKEIGQKVTLLQKKVTRTRTTGGMKVTRSFQRWELLSSHTARRTFCTLEYLAGTPALTIQAISGHKSSAAFLKYIKVTPDQHAKLLKLEWDKRAVKSI